MTTLAARGSRKIVSGWGAMCPATTGIAKEIAAVGSILEMKKLSLREVKLLKLVPLANVGLLAPSPGLCLTPK